MPRLPASAAARSLRMSACRLVATIVSSEAGRLIMRAVEASTSSLSQATSGNSFEICSAISSHITIAWRWALLLVMTVRQLARPGPGQLEGEAHDPLDAGAGHDRDVGRGFDRMALVDPAADARVLAFGVLAHDDPVEVVRTAALQRAVDPGQDARRPDVGVLVEALADLQAQAPERDVVRDVRIAGGAEQDRVLVADRGQAVLRHHRAVPAEVVAAPVEVLEREAEAAARPGERLQHLLAGRNDFLADAVAGNGRDRVGLHEGLRGRAGVAGLQCDAGNDAGAPTECGAPAGLVRTNYIT